MDGNKQEGNRALAMNASCGFYYTPLYTSAVDGPGLP